MQQGISFGGGVTPEIGPKEHAPIPQRPNITVLPHMDNPTNLTDQARAALENAQGIRTELFNTDRAEDFSTTQVNNTDNAFAPAFAPDPNTDLNSFNSTRRYGANSRRGRKSRKRSTRKSRGRKRSARKSRKSRGRKSRKLSGRKSRKSRGRKRSARKSRKSRGRKRSARKSRKSRGRKSRKSRGRKSRKSRGRK